MRLPNGYGSVHKLPGSRRNPWRARKTAGFEYYDTLTGEYLEDLTDVDLMELLPNGKPRVIAKQVFQTIGYFPTRAAALAALTQYNENPYDLNAAKMTFADVYERWSEEHFEQIVPSATRTWKSAYSYCKPLYNMNMRDIRVNHLEQTIKKAKVGDNTKARMKSLFNLMYKFAMKHEIVDKDYAALCESVKKAKPKIIRVPFSEEEITALWENADFPFADMVLIGIYSGWRPQELAILKVADIDLENRTFTGGLKTDAGRNRVVPIHDKIFQLVKRNYENALRMNSQTLFNDENGQQGTELTYDKYRSRFKKVMMKCKIDHRPHDTRHTFITLAKNAGVDEYILKMIVGHEIRDITEKVYTHRTLEDMHAEMQKIK